MKKINKWKAGLADGRAALALGADLNPGTKVRRREINNFNSESLFSPWVNISFVCPGATPLISTAYSELAHATSADMLDSIFFLPSLEISNLFADEVGSSALPAFGETSRTKKENRYTRRSDSKSLFPWRAFASRSLEYGIERACRDILLFCTQFQMQICSIRNYNIYLKFCTSSSISLTYLFTVCFCFVRTAPAPIKVLRY